MPRQIVLSEKMLRDMVRLREEFDIMVETLEIMSDPKLMKGIERSRKQAQKGRIRELKSVDEIDVW